MEKTCRWEYIEFDKDFRESSYDTECDNRHHFHDSFIYDSNFKFCPYCAGKIIHKDCNKDENA